MDFETIVLNSFGRRNIEGSDCPKVHIYLYIQNVHVLNKFGEYKM